MKKIIISYIRRNKNDLLCVTLLALTMPFFFYKLGISSLVSFDEAWYADIARSIIKTGNLYTLFWDGKPFYDHPPAGFWLIAISMKMWGINEFGARFAPAFCAFLSVFFIYFLGRNLFNRIVGFSAALALPSSFWFLFRARSGNLDTILTMFFILTLLLAVLSAKNKKWLIPFGISLSFLFLSKTIVPFTILPALVVIYWGNKAVKMRDWLLPIGVIMAITGSWFHFQINTQSNFINRYLAIGLPGVEAKPVFMDNIKLMKEYLHNGIGKWFWLGILGLFGGIFFRKKSFVILFIFFISFFIPFLFSTKGHIWHLIPLHPIMILAFFGLAYTMMDYIYPFIHKHIEAFLPKWLKKEHVFIAVLVGISIYFSFFQLKRSWYEFIDVNPNYTDEALLSKEASRYPQFLYIDGDYVPTARFYSDKIAGKIGRGEFKDYFNRSEQFLLITAPWRLEEEKIDPITYIVVKTSRGQVLIMKR